MIFIIALAVYLGIDEMAATIRRAVHSYHQSMMSTSTSTTWTSSEHHLPDDYQHVIVRGLADSGVFLNYLPQESNVHLELTALRAHSWYFPTPKELPYVSSMQALYALMNMSHGVPSLCRQYIRRMKQPEHLCLFVEYTGAVTVTPIFTKQVDVCFMVI
mgnify:CR=1 FL=1